MLKYELLRKGVDPATISEAVEETDELENALRAAKVKADRLPLIDFKLFSQKLSAYLQRRGFDYGVVSKIVKQAWQERTGNSGI